MRIRVSFSTRFPLFCTFFFIQSKYTYIRLTTCIVIISKITYTLLTLLNTDIRNIVIDITTRNLEQKIEDWFKYILV